MGIDEIDGIITTAKLFDKAISLSRHKGLDAVVRKTLAIELLVQESQYFLADGKLENAVSLGNDILERRFLGGANIEQVMYPIVLQNLLKSIAAYNNNIRLSKMNENERIKEYMKIAEKFKSFIIPCLKHLNNFNSSLFTAIAYNYHGLAARNAGEIKTAKDSFVEAIRDSQDIMATDDRGLPWIMYASFNLGKLLISEGDEQQGTMLVRTSLNYRRILYEQNIDRYENSALFEGQYGKACAEMAMQLLKQGNFDVTGRREEFEEMVREADRVYGTGRLDKSYTFRDYARMKILVFEHDVQLGKETTTNPVIFAKQALAVNALPTAPAWKESDITLFKKYL